MELAIHTRPRIIYLALLWWLSLAGALSAWASPPETTPATSTPTFGFTEPYFETVGDSESIPEGGIGAVVQDARGWLWIGTTRGLIRWDGYRFRKYVRNLYRPHSLPLDYVSTLYTARDGRLWVGMNDEGVAVFDPASENFTHFGRNLGMAGGKVRALQADSSGGIWVAADKGLDYIPASGAQPIHYRHDPNNPASLASNRVRALIVDESDTVWAGTLKGLQILKKGSKNFERIASDPSDPNSLAQQEIHSLYRAIDGKLWIGTITKGAAWLGPKSMELHWLKVDPNQPGFLSHPQINRIVQPNPEQIWLGTFGGGINIVSSKDGKVLRYLRHDPSNPNSLLGDSISDIMIDQSGLVWVATWGTGLQRYNPKNRAFHLLRHSPTQPNSLSHPSVYKIASLSDGSILVGHVGNGIGILDRQRGLIGRYHNLPTRPNRFSHVKALPMPSNHSASAMLETRDGTLWIGAGPGLFNLPKGSQTWHAIPLRPDRPAPAQIFALQETRDGTLWVGSTIGLTYWLPKEKRFAPLILDRSGTPVRGTTTLVEDLAGRIWLGNSNGLWVKTPDRPYLQNIAHDPKRPDSLISDTVVGLVVDKKGSLWVSTRKGLDRLLQWDGQRATFEHSSALAGHGEHTVGVNLLEDRQGRIWSEKFMFDPVKRKLFPFGKAEGFDVGAIWDDSFAKTHDGIMLFGGSKGLAVIDPEQFTPWDFQPQVQPTELKVDGKVIPAQIKELRLGPDQRNFSVEFSAFDFSAPHQNRYAYRLQGVDKDWIETDFSQRSASYGNLRPGQYTLQLRGSNRAGEWSPREFSLPVEILPAFWATMPFLVLMAFVLIGSVYAIYRLRVAHLHAKAEALQARTAEIMQAHSELAKAHGQLGETHHKLEETYERLQATQQQLLLQEKMAGLGTLTAGVAHEINNPVNFTHVAAQIQRMKVDEFQQYVLDLFDESVDPRIAQGFSTRFAELQENIDTMLNGTERITRIVKDLRSFTRLAEAETKSIPLSECLNATVNLVRTSWLEQVEFITDYVDDPEYECWPALLNQVFMNLLVNACQAIAEKRKLHNIQAKGHIYLRLKKHEHTLDVGIEDDGIGIEPEIQPRILEPFFTTKEVGMGTGLGLSISYGIIQKHHATLSFVSTPGEGSCFTIHLPLAT
jgi:signal transduction histidine kinase/ligand-binding sensor domain-containing protein